jgi:DHA1 family tetracycline resistance protein-like MFS transporter
MPQSAHQTPETAATEDRLDRRKVLPVFVIVLIDLLGLTIIIPMLPLYAASFGAGALTIGMLEASYPTLQLFAAPLLGSLSDRYGRKPILIISQVGTFIGFILLGLAGQLWMLFVARIIDGVSGANIATAQAVITDSTTEKTRTQGLGLIGAAFGLGFIIGPVIAFASLAISGQDYRVPAFVAAAFSAGSILLTWFWLDETLPKTGTQSKERPSHWRGLGMAFKHPVLGPLLGLMFAQQFAFGGFEQLLALFNLNRLGLNASGNAIIFVFVGVIVVGVQGGLIGPMSRRFGDRRLVYLGLSTLAVGLILTAVTPHVPVPWYSETALRQELGAAAGTHSLEGLPMAVPIPTGESGGWSGLIWILVAMVPASIGGGVLQPAINSLITQNARPERAGEMLGLSSGLMSAANAVAPLVGGAVFQTLGATAPFIGFGGLMAVLYFAALRWIRPSTGSAPAGG